MLLGFVYIGSTHYENNWFHSKFSDEINYAFARQVGENTFLWETETDNAKGRREFVLFDQGNKFKQLRPWTPNSHFHSLACLRDLVLVTHKKGTHKTQRAQQLLKKIEGLVVCLHSPTFLKTSHSAQPPSALRTPLFSTTNVCSLKRLHTCGVSRPMFVVQKVDAIV